MNPLISLLLVALAALGVILLLALGSSVLVIAAGKRYSQKHYEDIQNQVLELIPGVDAAMADKLLDGELQPESCQGLSTESLEKLTSIVLGYRAEQECIHSTSQDNQKNRPTKGRVRKFLIEKKDKGEWQ